MQLFDITLPTPAENISFDEAMLGICEERGGEALRFWESPTPFVVVGYGNELTREVNLSACEAEGVPVLRRCSGGGTVVQGSGCLNYALVLELSRNPALQSVSKSNDFILGRNVKALSGLLGSPVVIDGDTDLVWWGRKFSGNAQRRRRTHLLFHGTLLLGFDFSLLERYLPPLPPRQPDYRMARSHRDFLVNLPLAASVVKNALAESWQSRVSNHPCLEQETRRLVRERYGLEEWNRRL